MAARMATPTAKHRLREVGQPRVPIETKRDTFRRLLQNRVGNVVKGLGLVQKLGNREIYDIRPGDVDLAEEVLHGAVDDAVHALRHGGKPPPVLKFED